MLAGAAHFRRERPIFGRVFQKPLGFPLFLFPLLADFGKCDGYRLPHGCYNKNTRNVAGFDAFQIVSFQLPKNAQSYCQWSKGGLAAPSPKDNKKRPSRLIQRQRHRGDRAHEVGLHAGEQDICISPRTKALGAAAIR